MSDDRASGSPRRKTPAVLGLAWALAFPLGCSQTRDYYEKGHKYGYYDETVAAEKQTEAANDIYSFLPSKYQKW